MNRLIPIILSLVLIVLVGCGDEEQGTPNPLQVEILTEEDGTPVTGRITGRIIFTDKDKQVQAYPLSSNEYVIIQETSTKISGKSLIIYVDFPSNNGVYLMDGGYFQIENVEPGTHEIILMYTDDVVIAAEPGILSGDNYAKVEVPASHWTVTVEPGRNTTAGYLIITIPSLEWQSGKASEETVIPQEPEQPSIPTRPTTRLLSGMESAIIVTTDKVHQQEAGVIQNGNTFVIKAGGNDIWGNADQFTYAYQEVSGDFEFIIKVNLTLSH